MISDTVLFFVYSNRYDCANRIEGARRYAEKAGWKIQVIERNNVDRRLDVKRIIDFWKPVGIKSRIHFSRYYMTPLMEKGLVARTDPDNPMSPR